MLRILLVTAICGGVTVLLGMVNIWLGVLALPITYSFSKSLLE